VRREHAGRDPDLPHGSTIPEHLVDPHADRGRAGHLRLELNGSRQFLDAVHVVPHPLAVDGHGRGVPGADGVREVLGEQGVISLAGLDERIEKPAAVTGQTGFEQQPVFSPVLLKVKESLFLGAIGVGLEDNFSGEHLQPRQRIDVDKQGVSAAAEFHGLAAGRLHHTRRPHDGGRVVAQPIEPVQFPDHGLPGSAKGLGGERRRHDRRESQQ
jgi:hypothetical protein